MDEQTPNIIPPPILQEEPQKSKQLTWLIISILVGVLVIVISYFVYQKLTTKSLTQNPNSVNVATTTDQFADWKTYKNDKYDFEIKYPVGWFISESSIDGPWRLQSADPVNNAHGIGLPTVGNMWVDISSSVCHNPNNDNFTGFVAESKPDILEASECQDNFYITLGLWQADPDLNKNKQILNQILTTFKFITNQSLPQEILSNVIFDKWMKQKQTSYEMKADLFIAIGETPLKTIPYQLYDSKGVLLKTVPNQPYDGSVILCTHEYGNQSKCLLSPDRNKTFLIATGGEPDSDLFLYDKAKKVELHLEACGTPCFYEDGFWLDNNRFVLLETETDVAPEYYSANNEGKDIYTFIIKELDFNKNIIINWSANSKPI